MKSLLNIIEKSLFSTSRGSETKFVGKIGTFIFFSCQISSGCRKPEIVIVGCLWMWSDSEDKKGGQGGVILRHNIDNVCLCGL